MDTILIDLKIKRYLTQYDYLELELEETEYMFEQFNKQFLKEYYNIEEKPKIVPPPNDNSSPIDEQTSTDIPEINIDDYEEDDIDLKKIYKLLSLKTHPDKKTGNKNDFQEIHKAFKQKNVLKLIKFCIKYNIPLDNIIFQKSLILFENNITDIQTKIQQFKQTLAWQWCNATDEQKEILKQQSF